jgi:uncharacterized protein YecE (DUF72 family)
MKIDIGCSGYSYTDWTPAFYPAGTRPQDMLAYYARHFSTVEINFTYYRMPTAKTFMRMVQQTPEDFTFWVKAFGDFTHKKDRRQVGEFKAALGPLRDAGRLGGVLMQFPQSFQHTPENRGHLARLAEDFQDCATAVEFRHRSWARESVDEEFRRRDLSLVMVDVPKIENLYPPIYKATNQTAYLRLHSRDAGKWYSGATRYDYNYSDGELEEIVAGLDAILGSVQRLVVFFNNCQRGAAAENALRMKRILGLIADRPPIGGSDESGLFGQAGAGA